MKAETVKQQVQGKFPVILLRIVRKFVTLHCESAGMHGLHILHYNKEYGDIRPRYPLFLFMFYSFYDENGQRQ